jgi:hypothetical protein
MLPRASFGPADANAEPRHPASLPVSPAAGLQRGRATSEPQVASGYSTMLRQLRGRVAHHRHGDQEFVENSGKTADKYVYGPESRTVVATQLALLKSLKQSRRPSAPRLFVCRNKSSTCAEATDYASVHLTNIQVGSDAGVAVLSAMRRSVAWRVIRHCLLEAGGRRRWNGRD